MVDVTVAQIREMLNQYSDLSDNKIERAITQAKGILKGWNPEWETRENAFDALLQAAMAQTLTLHFPQDSTLYDPMFQKAAEMITSMWSSSFMLNKKKKFFRVINPTTE